jgi:ribonucleoside-diphosphate reductase alpha chain
VTGIQTCALPIYNIIKNRLNKNIIKPDFYPASELNINDIVGFPLPTYVCDNDNNNLDFYKFYGMMLGDGHHVNNKYFEYGITLNSISKINEQIFIKEFLTKLDIKFWISELEGCHKISWYDANNEKIKLTRNMFYDKNNNKRIYESFLHLPENKILKIIEGLLKTDGSNKKELYFTNTSLELIMQLRYLFLRLGILTSGCIKDNVGESHITKSGRTITTKQIAYSMRIPKHDKLKSIITFDKYKTKSFQSYKYFNN